MRMPRHSIQAINHIGGLNRPGHHPIPTGLFSAAAGLWAATRPPKTARNTDPGGNYVNQAGDRT